MKIALTFSGGGYRAAAYSLGVLSYLDRIKIGNKSMLEHVTVLSTVSGGTITGLRYALGIKNGENFDSIYNKLYSFLIGTDLISKSLERLTEKNGWDSRRVKSLINAFADVYDKELFDGKKFGHLMKDLPTEHLRHLSFNATEFDNALQFRFQWSEKVITAKPGDPERGLIGNHAMQIPEDIAREIRLGDILASSSCFPGGFEPINFPTDFILHDEKHIQILLDQSARPVGLMDGGIVDNQGIEPVLLAEARMQLNNPERVGLAQPGHELDLIMVADVASPFMDGYVASKQNTNGWLRKLTPSLVITLNTLLLIISVAGLYWSVRQAALGWIIFFSALVTLTLIAFLLFRWLKKLPMSFNVPEAFMKPLGKLLKLKFYVYENLIFNRADSLLKMTMSVFLKHVRRLNYKRIYEDGTWKNRRIMNAIYELKGSAKTKEENEIKAKVKGIYQPSDQIRKAATIASGMGTTLWFTKDQLQKDNMLNNIIGCGQFTTCWNLLEYIAKIKEDKTNTNENHLMLISCEAKLLEDWKLFQDVPLGYVKIVKQ
jgi:predicted acylesterase/phospholipase RssA